jgi:hypothetical protein
MLRYLRFAAAIAFALLAVAFVALWVRSYYRFNDVSGRLGGRLYGMATLGGAMRLYLADPSLRPQQQEWRWASHEVVRLGPNMRRDLRFPTEWSGRMQGLQLPFWFLALSSLALATLIAFKPITSFTVRGLLIATTLFAAVLGLAVYAV